MCGITGEIRSDDQPVDLAAVARMTAAMAARGPDAAGTWSQSRVAFGHRRLQVIDVSARARQPMEDAALGLVVVFNGCIYNHRELRAELEQLGYEFFSNGDTEVVLKAWHAWRDDCVRRFDGMFAFAVHERDTGRVGLARDRLGIKPLYLAEVAGALRFASTLPALLAGGGVDRSIDPVALQFYMAFHAVVPAPRTILQGVRKLPPATVLIVEPDGSRRESRYWDVSFEPDPEAASLDEADWRERIRDELQAAVERRLVADVPVGVLLSGGLDSSLVVALLARAGHARTETFSVGFESVGDEAGDEFRWSRLVAERFGTRHHEIPVAASRTLDALDATIAAMSEPMVSHDCVGFHLLSEEVSRHVKVVQSGQGADELFGGYHWYPPLLAAKSPVDDYLRVFRDRSHAEFLDAVAPRFAGDDAVRPFVAAFFAAPGATRAVDQALRIDTQVMLVDDPVKRVDNMTMAHGLEARVPFLDHHLVELVAKVPAELKVRGTGKHILKQVARGMLDDEWIDRPKGYFPVPALKYLQGPFLERVRGVLTDPASARRDIFRPEHVDRLLGDPTGHITPLGGSALWQCALLLDWLERHGV